MRDPVCMGAGGGLGGPALGVIAGLAQPLRIVNSIGVDAHVGESCPLVNQKVGRNLKRHSPQDVRRLEIFLEVEAYRWKVLLRAGRRFCEMINRVNI